MKKCQVKNPKDKEGLKLDLILFLEKKYSIFKCVCPGLSTKNNIEGLTYDRLTHQLILACKDSPDLGKKKHKGKSFFAYDLADDKLVSKPLFHLSLKKIRAFLATQKIKIKVSQFKPSGIAIHPITGQTYVLAHRGKWLIVLDQEYEIVGVSSLRHKLFGQPEGICFSPSGDLLIANEGQGDRGTLLYYKYRITQ